jgi:mannose-6-phosphate isomerase
MKLGVTPDATAAFARLKTWLIEAAYPIWWEAGADRQGGGFFDRLALDASPAASPRRVRVQARQAYAYAQAPGLGWKGPAEAASRHGLAGLAAFKRADGLYGPTPPRPPSPLDGMGELYDQAFVLLALANVRAAFGGTDLEPEAVRLRERLAPFAYPLGGYGEAPGLAEPLFANPNMHLFESFIAWSAISNDPAWRGRADALGVLALSRFIDAQTGALAESYDRDWTWPAVAQRVIWPGHLYEWAWLLMRWNETPATVDAALKLVRLAEAQGTDAGRKVAIFALDGAFAPTDRRARLWSQTERIKACALAAALTGDAGLWASATQACEGLERFLEVPTRGLWRDQMLEDGGFVEEAAPASSFYHIVAAIAELQRLTGG